MSGRRLMSAALKAGEVYTVAAVGPTPLALFGYSHLCVWLVERENVWAGISLGYKASRFRPLHDNSKTIEAMRNLMLDATVRGKVSA
jgi:hypothetical protein